MPVSGLVLVLTDDEPQQAGVLQALGCTTAIDVGRQVGNRVAVVIDTATRQEHESILEAIHRIPGVRFVEVAFVGFDPSEDEDSSAPSATLGEPASLPPSPPSELQPPCPQTDEHS